MSYSRRVIQSIFLLSAQFCELKFFRAPLAAFVLLCALATVPSQVFAQACGASITLTANQWRMVGIPCVLAPERRTIGGAFGTSLGVLNYGVTWVAWKRVYNDPAQCPVSSGPADCYIKLTVNSAVGTGDAFWIFSTRQSTLQLPSTSVVTPDANFGFVAPLSTNGNSRYYMFANPYNVTVNWGAFNFATTIFIVFPTTLTTDQAVTFSIVSPNVNYWNGNTYFTRNLGAATIAPKEAVWLEMLQPSPFVTPPVRVSIPKP